MINLRSFAMKLWNSSQAEEYLDKNRVFIVIYI